MNLLFLYLVSKIEKQPKLETKKKNKKINKKKKIKKPAEEYETDEEDLDLDDSSGNSDMSGPIRRSSRNRRAPKSYEEPSSDISDLESEDLLSSELSNEENILEEIEEEKEEEKEQDFSGTDDEAEIIEFLDKNNKNCMLFIIIYLTMLNLNYFILAVYDVIVIGAGISGISAASKLKSLGYNVLVIEARERLGGRIHTLYDDTQLHIDDNSPLSVDVGGVFIKSTDKELLNLCSETSLTPITIDTNDIVWYSDGVMLLETEDSAVEDVINVLQGKSTNTKENNGKDNYNCY